MDEIRTITIIRSAIGPLSRMKLGKYQHSKTGRYYQVLGVAKHSETLEEFVVYKALYDNPKGKLWIRPLSMFLEKVLIKGKKVPRFKFVKMV